jgi:tetratricopeptide (TPR) repeat protein
MRHMSRHILQLLFPAAFFPVLLVSCSAGFDNSRIRSLDIEARRYFDEGVRLSGEDRIDEAIQSYTRSIKINPGAAAYSNRAYEYNRKERFDDAIADANRAIMMNGKYAAPYFIRGNSYYRKCDFHRALKDYSRSIILDPDRAAYYYNLAQTYTRLGLVDEAIDMYGRAVEKDPGYVAAHYNRACLYAQKKETKKALESLARAEDTGLCNPAIVREEKSFDVLRNMPGFRSIIARLEKRFGNGRGCEHPPVIKPEP